MVPISSKLLSINFLLMWVFPFTSFLQILFLLLIEFAIAAVIQGFDTFFTLCMEHVCPEVYYLQKML